MQFGLAFPVGNLKFNFKSHKLISNKLSKKRVTYIPLKFFKLYPKIA